MKIINQKEPSRSPEQDLSKITERTTKLKMLLHTESLAFHVLHLYTSTLYVSTGRYQICLIKGYIFWSNVLAFEVSYLIYSS